VAELNLKFEILKSGGDIPVPTEVVGQFDP